MRSFPTQIVRPQQQLGFTCSSCGADRGCDCNAPAIKKTQVEKTLETLARRDRAKKTQQNQLSDPPVDNIREFPKRVPPIEDDDPGDSPEVMWRRGLIYRAQESAARAQFEDWSDYQIDLEVVNVAKRAAGAWDKLATYLEELYHEQQAKKA